MESLPWNCEDDQLEALALYWYRHRRRRRRFSDKRRCGISPFLRKNASIGFYNRVLPALKDDESRYFNYFRMSEEKFEVLLALILPHMPPLPATGRRPVSVKEQLCITLR